MASQFDRTAEDLGNIVALEHVNVLVPDQGLATLFYVSGLGLTRDPYMMTSTDNMWVNVGRSQFHLPTGKPQKLRGKIGLVISGRDLLLQRLERMKKPLAGTKYGFKDITDPKSGKKLFEIEHEIRSMTPPMFARPLLNRNPQQTNRTYVPGRDGFVPEAIAEDMPGRVGRRAMG